MLLQIDILCHNLLKLIPPEIALDFNRKKANDEKMEVEELIFFPLKTRFNLEKLRWLRNSENNFNGEKEKQTYKYSNNYKLSSYKRNIPSASGLLLM